MKKDSSTQSLMHKLQALAVKAGVPTQELRIDFLLERLVSRFLDNNNLQNNAVFKGGFVSNRVYQSERYTRDVDLSCFGLGLEDGINSLKKAGQRDKNDGVRFSYQDSGPIMGLDGTRLRFEASMGAKDSKTAATSHVTVDVVDKPVSIKDAVSTPTLLDRDALNWTVCAVEITIAEKIVGLLSRTARNSRGKDIYDLFRLIPRCDREKLIESINKSFALSEKAVPDDIVQALKKIDTTSLRENWEKALRYKGPKIGFDVAWNGTLDLLSSRLNQGTSQDIKALRNREAELLKMREKLGFVGTDRDALYGLGGYPKDSTPYQKKQQKELEKELQVVREGLISYTKTQDKGLGLGRKRN